MSLVAYDNSSDSESEENEESESKVTLYDTTRSQSTKVPNIEFTNLPQPKQPTSDTIEEDHDEFLKKKENIVEKPQKAKQPVKIGVSALSDFHSDDEDDDQPVKKKSKQAKASGLFALLPAPKGTQLKNTSFVPNVLQKKAKTSTTVKSVKIPPKKKTESAETVVTTDKDLEEEDDDVDVDADVDVEIPETFDDDTWQQVCGKQKRTVKPKTQEEIPVVQQDSSHIVELAPDVEKPYSGLDNQAFKELVGSRKRWKENIELIDIHEDEIRPDREEWLKSLTDPNCEPNADVKDPVNNTCKSKNHITSLAQKALANDKELQQRWSESRHNRRQTQAKYGF